MGDAFEGTLLPETGVIPRFCLDLFKKVEELHNENPPDDEVNDLG